MPDKDTFFKPVSDWLTDRKNWMGENSSTIYLIGWQTYAQCSKWPLIPHVSTSHYFRSFNVNVKGALHVAQVRLTCSGLSDSLAVIILYLLSLGHGGCRLWLEEWRPGDPVAPLWTSPARHHSLHWKTMQFTVSDTLCAESVNTCAAIFNYANCTHHY